MLFHLCTFSHSIPFISNTVSLFAQFFYLMQPNFHDYKFWISFTLSSSHSLGIWIIFSIFLTWPLRAFTISWPTEQSTFLILLPLCSFFCLHWLSGMFHSLSSFSFYILCPRLYPTCPFRELPNLYLQARIFSWAPDL